jgi:ubiquinone/menaquinone biosynthesis C-methylase UbiE
VSDSLPFDGTAPFYRFRVPYPPGVFSFLRSEFALDDGCRALDLGCGPGTLSIPLSRLVGEVVALDIDAGMLAEGERQAGHEGRANIRWLRSRAEDVSSDLGRFRLVTLGQSFHWMDRDLVLRRLTPLVEEGGGLALVAPSARRPQESWETTVDAVVEKYLGPRGRHPLANPELGDAPALLRSECFAGLSSREFPSEIERDVASILGYVYSKSSSSRRLFGDRIAEFERDLGEVLARANPSGVFREHVETEVVVARKQPRPS